MLKKGLKINATILVVATLLTVGDIQKNKVNVQANELTEQVNGLNNTIKGYVDGIKEKGNELKGKVGESDIGLSFDSSSKKESEIKVFQEPDYSLQGAYQAFKEDMQGVLGFFQLEKVMLSVENTQPYQLVAGFIGESSLNSVISVIFEGGKSVFGLYLAFSMLGGLKNYFTRKEYRNSY